MRVSHNYQQAAKAGNQEQLLSVWTTPRGRYLYSNFFPSQTIVEYFGGVYFWNGSDLVLGSGQTWGGLPVCEYDQRILNPGSIKTTIAPIKGELLVSLGQTERGVVAIDYDNADDYFSELWGDQRNEPFLYQRHELFHGFVGLDPGDFVNVFDGEIRKLKYDKIKAVVYSIAQSKVFVPIPDVPTLTAYALRVNSIDNVSLLIHSGASGGTTFTDAGPTGHSLTRHGSIVYSSTQAGKFKNYAIEFDGTDDYLTAAGHADFALGAGEFSLSFFVYITADINSRYFLAQDDSDVSKWGALYGYGGIQPKVAFFDWTTATYSSEVVPTSQWVHICMQRESDGKVRVYFDGVLKSTPTTISTDYNNNTDTVYIGFGADVIEVAVDPYFQGWMDEILILKGASIDSADLPPAFPYTAEAIPVMAQETLTHAALASAFFATDDWTCNTNFVKDALGEAGVLFLLENDGTETTLEIGIDASNHPYVTTGQDVEGTPATTTYTSTLTLTVAQIAGKLNLNINYSHTDSEIVFSINGTTDTVVETDAYDRTGTNDEQITLGKNFNGEILNLKFREHFFITNNEGDNTLATIPDVISGHDLTLVDGGWEAW